MKFIRRLLLFILVIIIIVGSVLYLNGNKLYKEKLSENENGTDSGSI